MKKFNVLIICFLLLSCSQNLHDGKDVCFECKCLKSSTGKLVWDYPVKPGMEKWKQFQSHEEMVIACQIPEKILHSLSTEDLAKICLQYPLLSDVFVFNFLSMGADKLYNDFNGIRELFKRKKASKELLKHYNCVMQEFEGVNSFMPVWNLEFLLGFYTQRADILSKDDYKEILQCLLYGHEKEIVHYDPDFRYPFPYNFYARANVINKISPQSFEKMPYLYDGNSVVSYDKESMNIINELSYQLIK